MTFETFDQRDEETWPDQQNRQWQRQIQWQRQRQRQLPIHLENTLKERPQRLVTFETFDQSDEETWPDQNRQWQWQWQWQWHLENTLKDQSSRLVTFETLITFMTIENNNLNIHSVPWIKSDRDSIRNSCDVLFEQPKLRYVLKTFFPCNASRVDVRP